MGQRTRRSAPLIAITIVTATSVLRAQIPALSPQTSIITLRHEWNVAMTQRDTARLGRLIADDAIFLSNEVRLHGRDQVTAVFGRLFNSYPDFRLVFSLGELTPAQQVVTDSVVSEYGTWHETFNTTGGTVVMRGTYYDIWRRGPQGWRIAVHGFSRTSCTGNRSYCRGS